MSPSLSARPSTRVGSPYGIPVSLFPLLGFTVRCLQSRHLSSFGLSVSSTCGYTHTGTAFSQYNTLLCPFCLASLDRPPPQSQSFISLLFPPLCLLSFHHREMTYVPIQSCLLPLTAPLPPIISSVRHIFYFWSFRRLPLTVYVL